MLFAQINSRELKRKSSIAYVKPEDTTKPKKQNYSITGNSYYQSLCMRAVNQSIGRAIRHANDYATIMLVDERYVKDEKVRKLLPDWISQQIVYPEKRPGVSPLPSISFGKMMGTVSSFFHSKRKQDN